MEKESVLKEQGKKNCIKDGVAYSIMDGAGLRFITPYALALGSSNKFIGFLTMFPSFLGNLLRMLFNKMYETNSRKKTVKFWVSVQAFFWFPLILTGVLYFFFNLSLIYSLALLIVSYCGIVVSGALAIPAWNSWMQDLVQEDRGKFFSKRNRIMGFTTLVIMFLGGFLLDYFEKREVFFGFMILFLVAAFGRFFSIHYLKKQYEPKFKYDPSTYFSFIDFIKRMSSNNFGKFVIFASLMSFGVAISSPFFAVYMIKDLQLSYISFTLITMGSIISTLFFLPFWGKVSDKYGTVLVFRFCAFFISLVPVFWLVSSFLNLNLISLIVLLVIIEMFSGFVWAGYNLSTTNFIYDAVSRQRLAICVTYFSFISSIGYLIGGLLGGFLSSSPQFSLFGLSAILSVFLISVLFRILPVLLIGIKLKEVRNVEKPKSLIFSFLNLKKYNNP